MANRTTNTIGTSCGPINYDDHDEDNDANDDDKNYDNNDGDDDDDKFPQKRLFLWRIILKAPLE